MKKQTTMRVNQTDYEILQNIAPYLSVANTLSLLLDMLTDGYSPIKTTFLSDTIIKRVNVISEAVSRELTDIKEIEREKQTRYANMKRRPTALDARLAKLDLSDLDRPIERLSDDDKAIIIEYLEQYGRMPAQFSLAFEAQQEAEMRELHGES